MRRTQNGKKGQSWGRFFDGTFSGDSSSVHFFWLNGVMLPFCQKLLRLTGKGPGASIGSARPERDELHQSAVSHRLHQRVYAGLYRHCHRSRVCSWTV